MNNDTKRGKHRRNIEARHHLRSSVTAAALAATIATGVGAGVAQGVPEQGGTTPNNVPEQGGTMSGDAPQQTVPIVEPGPGSIPGPPREAPYQPYTAPDSTNCEDAYSPMPQERLTAPRPVRPVRPIAPPPKKIRIGNFVSDIPQGMSIRDVNSINAWSAYGESKIAQGLISMGVPEDEASRQAAATIIGVMMGGTAGAVTAGVPAAVVGGVGGAVVGAGVGAVIGYSLGGVNVGPGALIGAGVGAVAGAAVLGIPAAVVGAVTGGTIGGLIAYTLGAGDPGADAREPWQQDRPGAPRTAPLPNPQGNQFELRLSPDEARQVGLPAVDYVVTTRGDVRGQVAGLRFGWSAEQARAPYRVLGAQAERVARDLTKQGAAQLKSTIPGVDIAWPQEEETR